MMNQIPVTVISDDDITYDSEADLYYTHLTLKQMGVVFVSVSMDAMIVLPSALRGLWYDIVNLGSTDIQINYSGGGGIG